MKKLRLLVMSLFCLVMSFSFVGCDLLEELSIVGTWGTTRAYTYEKVKEEYTFYSNKTYTLDQYTYDIDAWGDIIPSTEVYSFDEGVYTFSNNILSLYSDYNGVPDYIVEAYVDGNYLTIYEDAGYNSVLEVTYIRY